MPYATWRSVQVGSDLECQLSMDDQVIIGLLKIPLMCFLRMVIRNQREMLDVLLLTFATNIHIDDIADAHIDNPKKALILLLELLLIKYLNR